MSSNNLWTIDVHLYSDQGDLRIFNFLLHKRLMLQLVDTLSKHVGILYGVSPNETNCARIRKQFEMSAFGSLQVIYALLHHLRVALPTTCIELDRQFIGNLRLLSVQARTSDNKTSLAIQYVVSEQLY